MEFIAFILTVILISLSGVLAPGPLFAATIAEGKTNRFAGFLIALGHAIVEIPIILALFFFGVIIATDFIKSIVGLIGGFVLLYLAYLEVKSKKEVKPARGVFTGVIMSSLNPYFIIWWLTIGFKLIMDSIAFGLIGLIGFIIAHEFCDFSWLGFISFSSNKSTEIWGEKAFKILTAVSVTILVFFGIYFIYTGFTTLLY
ncbi:lysine transporter LysE [Archaeoglobales archaeon]|nr:MAG: lysine transporter LysE [Archaeoglobales archaeon]